MKRSTRVTLAVLIALAGAITLVVRVAANRATADSRFRGSSSLRAFDPRRDAFVDLQQAKAQAAAGHRNILLDVGGNWCPSCILFDQSLQSDPRLRELLSGKYVLLHVNWSSDNRNEHVLKLLPSPHGFPMIYVLGPSGAVLVAQGTSAFEDASQGGGGYDHRALERFLIKYETR